MVLIKEKSLINIKKINNYKINLSIYFNQNIT